MNNYYDIFSNWYDNSGIFECFFKSTPFTTMRNYEKEVNVDLNFKLEESKASYNEIKATINLNNLIIVDIEGEKSIEYGYLFYEDCIKPILSFNHIFHKYGIVGTPMLASKLIRLGKMINPNKKYKSYCFVLDSGRYINEIDLNNPKLYNNQYEVSEEELPYIEILKDNNITEVEVIIDKVIKEDLELYLKYLKANDINVYITDIQSMRRAIYG